MSRRQLGQLGEEAAGRYLAGRGCRILARNWRCASGELDLIVLDGETLVFVEVRTRRDSLRMGTPEESVDLRKRRQIMATASVYIHLTGQHHRQARFDVVAVQTADDGAVTRLDHFPDAF